MKQDVDHFLRTRDRKLLESIREKLRLPKKEALQMDTKYNVPLLNALLLYVGMHLPQHVKNMQVQGGLQHKVCESLHCVRHYILNWLRMRQNIAEEMIPLGRYANLDLGLDLERIVRLWAPLAEVEAAAAAAEAEAALAEDP
jgi:hypothetical protein